VLSRRRKLFTVRRLWLAEHSLRLAGPRVLLWALRWSLLRRNGGHVPGGNRLRVVVVLLQA